MIIEVRFFFTFELIFRRFGHGDKMVEIGPTKTRVIPTVWLGLSLSFLFSILFSKFPFFKPYFPFFLQIQFSSQSKTLLRPIPPQFPATPPPVPITRFFLPQPCPSLQPPFSIKIMVAASRSSSQPFYGSEQCRSFAGESAEAALG